MCWEGGQGEQYSVGSAVAQNEHLESMCIIPISSEVDDVCICEWSTLLFICKCSKHGIKGIQRNAKLH